MKSVLVRPQTPKTGMAALAAIAEKKPGSEPKSNSGNIASIFDQKAEVSKSITSKPPRVVTANLPKEFAENLMKSSKRSDSS